MDWHLPNQLTVGRMVLSAAFFVLVGVYEPAAESGPLLLNIALALYIVAGITDVLDGYLARKMNLTSAFGRIVDPFVDKVLVVGAFVMLTGSNLSLPAGANLPEHDMPAWLSGGMHSAVQAWMVVVILAREFIVSAVRGYSESQGIKFPAIPAGKIKMFVQSIAICTVLFQIANVPQLWWMSVVKIALVWSATAVTVLSGLAYVGRIRRLMAPGEPARE